LPQRQSTRGSHAFISVDYCLRSAYGHLGDFVAGGRAPGRSPTEPHPLAAADVGAWLDGFIPEALLQGDVAGAVVVVVKNGETVAQVGYGYSDVESHKPVDAERTLFRVGSVSKLFTWTAVMQLVEQGKLDLDTDVNRYVDFSIPARDGKPITLRNIMTHTAGFEERLTGLIGVDGDDIAPLGEFLKRYVPSRIFPPVRHRLTPTMPRHSRVTSSRALRAKPLMITWISICSGRCRCGTPRFVSRCRSGSKPSSRRPTPPHLCPASPSKSLGPRRPEA